MTAREAIDHLVKGSILPHAKAAGFKKSGLGFYRDTSSLIQVVNFQVSTGGDGRFYVNVGLLFGDLHLPRSERPKEHECDYRKRMEHLIASAPAAWEVGKLAPNHLEECFKLLIQLLDGVRTSAEFLNSPLSAGELEVCARLHYALGNYTASLDALRGLAEKFADRRGMSLDELIVRLKLDRLIDHL
jgi:Domain of unknown function (DUF4304)